MKYKVMVADDEHIIRRGIVGFLKKYYQLEVVAEAENGEEALETARSMELDILFVDINMPILNGLQFVEQLRKVQPKANVVIITGYDDFEYARQALRLQVKEYILKPLMEETFDSAVRRVIQDLDSRFKQEKYEQWAYNIVEENKKSLIRDFLGEWLEGRLSEEEIREKQEYLKLQTADEHALVIVHLDYILREDKDHLWDSELISYAAENIAAEIYEEISPVCTAGTQKEILVMLGATADEWKMKEWMELTKEMIQKYLPVYVNILYMQQIRPVRVPEQYEQMLEEMRRHTAYPGSVKEVIQFIEQNYDREELSLSDAARSIGISTQHLSRLFKKEMGVTFVDYLTKVRIRKSLELLASEELKIYEVAERVGYSTQHYFSSVFKKTLGVSPAEYRKGQAL